MHTARDTLPWTQLSIFNETSSNYTGIKQTLDPVCSCFSPSFSLSSKIKNLLFSSKENLLTFLHAETKRTKREKRNEGGGKGEETPLSPFQGGFANRPLGIITRHEPRRACLPIAAIEEKTRHQIERELVSLSPSVACVPSVPDQNTEAGGPGDKFSSLSSQEDLVTRAYVRPTSPLGRVRDPRVVVRRAWN